jgi:CRP/FNR family transcriptional regulator, cyclic AMP receptor protein
MSDIIDGCAHLPRIVVPAGNVVIEQGRPFGTVLVLVEGGVVVERDGLPIARVDQPGSIFGEMSSLLGRPATATVRTTIDSTFLVAEDGEQFLLERPDIVITVARTLAIRLDNLTGYLADVKRQFGDQANHLGMLDDVMQTLIHNKAPAVQPGSARMPELDY